VNTQLTEENRTEFNLRSGKSEAEVIRLIIENCAQRIVLLKLITDMKHRAASLRQHTAGLLVLLYHFVRSLSFGIFSFYYHNYEEVFCLLLPP